MAATSPAQAAPDMRALVAKLQQRSFAAFAVCVAALLGAQLLRTVAPPAGSADAAAQMPWVQPHLRAMRAAWLAEGGPDAQPGAALDVAACRDMRALLSRASERRVLALCFICSRVGGRSAVCQHNAPVLRPGV